MWAGCAALGQNVVAFKRQETDQLASWQLSSNPLQATGEHLANLGNGVGYWQPAQTDSRPTITIQLPQQMLIGGVVLKEQITVGQRIERATISVLAAADRVEGAQPAGSDSTGGALWQQVAEVEAVGYKPVLRFPAISASALRVEILESREQPTLSFLVILPESYGQEVS